VNAKYLACLTCAVALGSGAYGSGVRSDRLLNPFVGYSGSSNTNRVVAAENTEAGWDWSMGKGLTYVERSIVSGEVTLAFDSKFLSYGLVDNNEPILTPEASLMFFDWANVGILAVCDITSYGDAAGYGNRAWRHQEIDPYAALEHEFGPEDASWLPTAVAFELGYMYEGHPKYVGKDTQFVSAAVELPDLWIAPRFFYELDVMRDHGTYLNLELAHTFALIDGKASGDDPTLGLRISAAQGWGSANRVGAYLWDVVRTPAGPEVERLDRAGLMDTCVKGALSWLIRPGVKLTGYVAYYDFLFDSAIRDAASHYEMTGSWEHSWNFVAGVAISVGF